jgi:transposase
MTPRRNQMELVQSSLNQRLSPKHRARMIWAVVEKLDLREFYDGIAARGSEPGRPTIDPRILVALWLYATVKGVGIARELARLCQEHLAYQWLCGGVGVNYHTLADFRVEHQAKLDGLMTQVLTGLMEADVVSEDRGAADGMRVRASAGASSFHRKRTLEELQELARAQVERLKQAPEEAGSSARKKAAAVRAARERQEKVQRALEVVDQLRTEKPPKALRTAAAEVVRPDAAVAPPPEGAEATLAAPPESKASPAAEPAGPTPPPAPEAAEAAVAELPEPKATPPAEAPDLASPPPAGAAEAAPAAPTQREAKPPAEPRVSTTDPEARVMKMADGGFRPAYNVQLAADTKSRAIVGVGVSTCGSDMGHAEPLRQEVERRLGEAPKEMLADGGFASEKAIEAGSAAGTTMYLPVQKPRRADVDPHAPKPGDSQAVAQWRKRMGTDEAKGIYKLRAATIETVNGDLREHRGLTRFNVRGQGKVLCVALWAALAYNILHFSDVLLAALGT